MPEMTKATLAIDFGTSNSAAAILHDGAARRIPIERFEETLPTAVFFPSEGGMLIGAAAGEALIAGEDGRYMRALKSVLGTALFHETRLVGGKRRTLADIVTAFLSEVKDRAQQMSGQNFSSVVSGRPVKFHSGDPERDARAAQDLADCYRSAGFSSVRFVFEPEAAALAAAPLHESDKLGLIVDIGGGTSDFTVYQGSKDGPKVLTSHGIRLGGTDFDKSISLAHAMPLLGHGGTLKRDLGDALLPVPNRIYVDLASWATIPFLYTPDTRREVADYVKHATDPTAMTRLATVLEDELGHDLAFAVERGKIAANGASGTGRIAMGLIEKGLAAELPRASMNAALAQNTGALRAAMAQTLVQAGVGPEEIGAVVLVGGSSLMALVEETARSLCFAAKVQRTDAFTAVVDGLALAIERDIGVFA